MYLYQLSHHKILVFKLEVFKRVHQQVAVPLGKGGTFCRKDHEKFKTFKMPWIWKVLLSIGLFYLIAIRMTLCKPVQSHSKNPRHQSSHRKLRNARIKAIKEEILTKLGLSDIPSMKNVTLSVEEERKKIKLFKKSLEDTYGQIHELFSQEEFFAKKFHSFSQNGEYFISEQFSF